MKEIWESEREQKNIQEMAGFFKLLSTPSRIQLLLLLINRESGVTELADKMKVTQSSVSHQLNLLKLNRLVTSRREGRKILYMLCDEKTKQILLSWATKVYRKIE